MQQHLRCSLPFRIMQEPILLHQTPGKSSAWDQVRLTQSTIQCKPKHKAFSLQVGECVPRSTQEPAGQPPWREDMESGSAGPQPVLGSLPPVGGRSSQGGGAQWLPDWWWLLRNTWGALQIGQTPLLGVQPLPADSDPVGLEGGQGSTFLRAPQ